LAQVSGWREAKETIDGASFHGKIGVMATRREFLSSALSGALLGPTLSSIYPRLLNADDEKVAKQLAKLDAEFVKALTDLAKKYDKDQIPEAAHFFASCGLGFGAKDETLSSIKASYEASVYLGRLRGGEPLKETAPITGALGSVSTSYKKLLDPWVARARKGDLGESTRKLMLDTGIKYELSRGAHEYVQTTQRFNALRRKMGLRAILWDFETSSKLILAAWYTVETEDWEYREPKKASIFFSDGVEKAAEVNKAPMSNLPAHPDLLRSLALTREHLLNCNARQLWLAHWNDPKRVVEATTLYAIPQLSFRTDIPTPTQRFRGETFVQDWVETEDTVEVGGRKVPYVRYPYSDEPDSPFAYCNGRGEEIGWASSEKDFLRRAGIPIMLRVFIEGEISDVEAELRDSSGGKYLCRRYTNGDKRVDLDEGWATLLLVPEKQLEGPAKYTVSVKCKVKGTPFEKSWSFSTRAK
jgi:hypothetical protein